MTAIPFRSLLSAMLLPLMTGAGVAIDLSPTSCFPDGTPSLGTNCSMLPYNILMVVNDVKMKDATLDEAVACIRAAVAKAEGAPNNHINFVILGKVPDPTKRVSLDLKQTPLKLAVEEVARTFGMQVRPEFHAVVLAPPSYPDSLHTRTYRLPPFFIQTGSAAK